MSPGIIELITLLLGLAGFGVHADPKPPTVDAALAYAVPDPDLVVQIDATALVPGNYRALIDLPSHPALQHTPDVSKAVRQVTAQLEGGRGFIKQTTGIDLATDITDATVFIQLTHGDPSFLATLHGTFTTDTIDRLAVTNHRKVTPASGGAAWVVIDDNTAAGVTKTHALIVGMTPWVRDRMADGWRAPSHAAGTSLAYAAAAIDTKPVLAVVSTLSAPARQELTRGQDLPVVIADLVARHKAAWLAIYADGMGWSWTDTTPSGLAAMSSMSDGAVDLLRAAQIAPRGVAKIALGALESYRSDKGVAELLAHRDELMAVVGNYSSDGAFKVAVNLDTAKLTLTTRVTGKSTGQVVPLGFLLPLGALGALVKSSR